MIRRENHLTTDVQEKEDLIMDEAITPEQAAEKARLDAMLHGEVPADECRAYIATKLNQPHPDSKSWRGCIVCGTYYTMGHCCGCPISALQRMLDGKEMFYGKNPNVFRG